MDYYASLNEHKKKGGKSIVMSKPEDFKEKPPVFLANEARECIKVYQENMARA